MTLQELKHFIAFHTAIPKDYPESPFNAEENMIGTIVILNDDDKKQEYEVLRSGPISRGPMRQLKPSITFLCRKPMCGYGGKYFDYFWFRKDSLKFIR